MGVASQGFCKLKIASISPMAERQKDSEIERQTDMQVSRLAGGQTEMETDRQGDRRCCVVLQSVHLLPLPWHIRL